MACQNARKSDTCLRHRLQRDLWPRVRNDVEKRELVKK
jgi:hypothetical protein